MRYRLAMPFLREPSHILILLIVVVVLFGAKRLPDSARSLGRSLRIFKSEMKDMKDDGKDQKDGTAGPAGQ
ncbi:TatA Sec-independent protein secretion pathway components [Candidatus Nanopelagicaceae bacterium]